jgi:nucleoside-diphosphate-sugar epimerase
MSDCIAVIGSNGYLGRAVAQALGNAGRTVIGINRTPTMGEATMRSVAADIALPQSAARVLDGIDMVVNCANGDTRRMRRLAENLATWQAQDHARSIIQISSLAVFGSAVGTLSEASLPVPKMTHPYAVAKRAIEQTILTNADASRICVVIRPGCIYGPGATQWVDSMMRLLRARRLGHLAALGEGDANIIHVQDIAAAIVRAATSNQRLTGALHLLHPERISWNTYFARLSACLDDMAYETIDAVSLDFETFIAGRLRKLSGTLTRRPIDRISPVWRAMFRSRAHFTSIRPTLLQAVQFTPLSDGLPHAARAARQCWAAR